MENISDAEIEKVTKVLQPNYPGYQVKYSERTLLKSLHTDEMDVNGYAITLGNIPPAVPGDKAVIVWSISK